MGILKIHSVAKNQKNEGGPLETLKTFKKSLTKPKKKAEKSHSAKKKLERGPFCFGMVLYLMLEALNAFRVSTLVETAGTFYMLQACMQGNCL